MFICCFYNFWCALFIIRVVNDIPLSMESGFTNIILLDLSAAFDMICHDVLVSHLSDIGIGGYALSWFISYLSHRK